jgi:hypothetical protein
MNAPIRLVPAAAAFLLAAVAGSVICCRPPTPPPPDLRPGKAVTVIVTYDEEARTATMSDKTIQLSEGSGDWAQWVSPYGLVHVTFPKASPFESLPAHERKVLKSLRPKKGTQGQGFDYTAELELFSDGSRVKVDPRIEIVP